MYGYVYETINLINGKKYIGKHVSNSFDSNYYGSGKNLIKAFNKYGKENFSIKILKECDSLEELNKEEIYYIKKFNAVKDKNYYNIALGGNGGNTWDGQTNENKVIISNKISLAHDKQLKDIRLNNKIKLQKSKIELIKQNILANNKRRAICILYKEDFSISEIAEMLNISHTHVRRILISNDIKIKPRSQNNNSKLLIGEYTKLAKLKN